MTEIYRKIEKLRKDCNMPQTELAKRLDISRSAVSAWEMDISKPHIEHVIAMAKIFHVTTDYLLDMSDSRYMLDISGLCDKEQKIVVDLANALRDRT